MRVNSIRLFNFRNYETQKVTLNEGLNLFVGENAQGKTNLLEAVFLCALGRSHRTKNDQDMIRTCYDSARVKLGFTDRLGNRQIEIELNRRLKKRVRIDSKLISRSGEQMGCLNVVMFSPEDLSLVKDGPGERRRFMDMELSQIRPAYYFSLQNYVRAVKQRNALLKSGCDSDEQLLVWEKQMADAASVIIPMREAFVERLNQIAKGIHSHICRNREELSVAYEPCFSGGDTERFMEEQKKRREVDTRRGATTFGVHREDLILTINGESVRLFASQGQQRTSALSLKLSEIALMEEMTGNKPVVLLDDVLSELDEYRQGLLFSAVEGAQVLVTATRVEGIDVGEHAVYVVSNGKIHGSL